MPFCCVLVDLDAQAQKQPAYLELYPNGLITVLEDGELLLCETAAILKHLVDRHPAAQMPPTELGSARRAHLSDWVVRMSVSLQAAFLRRFYPGRLVDVGNIEGAAQVKAAQPSALGRILCGSSPCSLSAMGSPRCGGWTTAWPTRWHSFFAAGRAASPDRRQRPGAPRRSWALFEAPAVARGGAARTRRLGAGRALRELMGGQSAPPWCVAIAMMAVALLTLSATTAAAGAAASAPSAASSAVASALTGFNVQLGEALSLGLKLFVLLVAVPFGARIAWTEWRRDPLVIDPLDVPKDLADAGLSGAVLSQIMADSIYRLQRDSRPDDDAADIAFVELPKMQVDLQLPGMTWTVSGLVRYLKQAAGQPQRRLIGEVTKLRSAYSLRLRLGSGPALDVPVRFHNASDLTPAMAAGAEAAIALSSTFEAATIAYARDSVANGYAATVEAIRRHLATAPVDRHQDAYVLWASVFRAMGDNGSMEAKLVQARACTARPWQGQVEGPLGPRYCNFVGSLHRERREFARAERLFKLALAADPRNVAGMANLGYLYSDRWRLSEAEFWFRRAIRARPQSSRGYRGLGWVAMRRNDLDAALVWMERAIDVAPAARWPRMNRIELLRRSGRLREALKAAETFVEIEPGFAPILRTLGDILRDLGEHEAALATFRRARALEPGEPLVFQGQASVLRQMGRHREAIDAARSALSLRPAMPSSRTHLALSLKEEGADEEALAELQATATLWPEEPASYANLAVEYRRRGRWELAHQVLAAAPPHARTSPEVLRAEGWLAVDIEQPANALACFEAACAVAPHERWNSYGRAEALRRLGCHVASLEICQGLCEQSPWDAEALRRQAIVQWDLGRIDDAFASVRAAIALGPSDPWAHLALFDFLRMSGRTDEALDVLQDEVFQASATGRREALARRADTLRDRGDLEAARAGYEQRLAQDPTAVHVCLATSSVLREGGRFDEALALAERAKKMAPQQPFPLLRLADVLGEQGAEVRALEQIERAIQLAPWHVASRVAHSSMLQQMGRTAQAIAAAREACTLHPANLGAMQRLVSALLGEEWLEHAEEAACRATHMWPADPRSWLALGDVLLRHEKLGSCQRAADAVLAINPKHGGAWRLIATLREQLGELTAALAAVEHACQGNPGDVWLQMHRADLLRASGAHAEAMVVLESVHARLPHLPIVERRLGWLAQSMKDPALARHHFEQALALAPALPGAHHDLSDWYMRQGEWTQAQKHADLALQQRPDDAAGHVLAVRLLRKRGECDTAARRLERTFAQAPRSLSLAVEGCELHAQRKDWPAAIAAGRLALSFRPRRPASLQLLAKVLKASGDVEGGAAQWQQSESVLATRTNE